MMAISRRKFLFVLLIFITISTSTTFAFLKRNANANNTKNNTCDAKTPSNKREIILTAELSLPFSSYTAFDRFSYLPHQPLWSPSLRKVEFLTDESIPEMKIMNRRQTLPDSKWTMSLLGIPLSWKARVTIFDRPRRLEWETISGVYNAGSVLFKSQSSNECIMTVSMKAIAPYAVAVVFRRIGLLERFMNNHIILPTLLNFREIVADDLKQNKKE